MTEAELRDLLALILRTEAATGDGHLVLESALDLVREIAYGAGFDAGMDCMRGLND